MPNHSNQFTEVGEQRLLKEHYEELTEESLIDEWAIKENEVHTETDAKVVQEYLNWNYKGDLEEMGPFLVFPYPNIDSEFVRVKPLNPRKDEDGDIIKYESPVSGGIKPYLPHRAVKKIKQTDKKVIITEGEKKALCGISHNLVTISIPGVFTWRQGKGDDVSALHKELKKLLVGKDIVIIFDSDILTNEKIKEAANRLKEALKKLDNDNRVKEVTIPGVDGKGTGMDDYLRYFSINDLRGLINKDSFETLDSKPGGGQTGQRATRETSDNYYFRTTIEVIQHLLNKNQDVYYMDETWYFFNGKTYTKIVDESVIDDIIRRYLIQNDAEKITNHSVNEIRKILKTYRRIPAGLENPFWIDKRGWDAGQYKWKDIEHPVYIFENKMVEIKVNEQKLNVHDHTPDIFTTKSVDYKFEPDAKCPRWKQFLEEQWGDDEESQKLCQQMMGYVVGNMSHLQKVLMMIGTTGAGKSVITNIMSELISNRRYAGVEMANLDSNFGLQPFLGKDLVVFNDVQLGRKENRDRILSTLKTVSGQDITTVDRKYKSPKTTELNCSIVIVGNKLPRFDDIRNAFLRRVELLWFSTSFYGREDPNLTQKLIEELPGIFNWSVKGLWDLMNNGFVTPEISEIKMAGYSKELNVIRSFFEDKCLIDRGNEQLFVSVDDLYKVYEDYVEEQGFSYTWNKRRFNKKVLQELNYDEWSGVRRPKRNINGNSFRVHLGIAIKDHVKKKRYKGEFEKRDIKKELMREIYGEEGKDDENQKQKGIEYG